MRLEKQLIAFGAIILVGGTLLAGGQALAFGQQWRPAQGFGTASARPYQQIANMPGFRPHGAAGPAVQRSFNQYRQRSRQPAYPRYASHRQPQRRYFANWQGYPRQHPAAPFGSAYNPSPHPMMAGYPGAGGGSPFVAMRQPWGRQIPMFSRQFAWRPASRPWVAAPVPMTPRPQYRQYRYTAPAVPQMVGFRPTGPGYSPLAGSWRPAIVSAARAYQPHYGYPRYASRTPVYTGQQRPVFRSVPGSRYPMPRVAGLKPAPVRAAYWRPDAVTAPMQPYAGRSFRPQAYGRTTAAKKQLASGDGERLDFTRNNLPGWVTTYQDNAYEASCSWCGGS